MHVALALRNGVRSNMLFDFASRCLLATVRLETQIVIKLRNLLAFLASYSNLCLNHFKSVDALRVPFLLDSTCTYTQCTTHTIKPVDTRVCNATLALSRFNIIPLLLCDTLYHSWYMSSRMASVMFTTPTSKTPFHRNYFNRFQHFISNAEWHECWRHKSSSIHQRSFASPDCHLTRASMSTSSAVWPSATPSYIHIIHNPVWLILSSSLIQFLIYDFSMNNSFFLQVCRRIL